MKQSQNKKTSWLRPRVLSISRIHFIFVFSYTAQIVLFNASNILTPYAVMQRWIVAGLLLSINVFVWYIAKNKVTRTVTYKKLVFLMILADIAMASFNVYVQRGMASKAVALYAIPIVVSAILASRSALIATSTLCIIAYTTTSISYFVLNFNEGYKAELYGEIATYSVLFIVLALLLWTVVRHNHSE
ncbi:MAG: hypothetical protein WCK69_00475 [Candidatus Saccharibacteria bacterium]